ncbi:MAG: tRNA (adenosine(37)-N6)-threonylcarbamoyltransferase complex transferase subunit TsaD [Candidatus Moranbacteria bacterium]|nr:tRNA (adenosine(37)-N6)-threonylcarbamoyltransferase complex transferase subunit TsaD [Candidatus Moranbacteria bacterium]
MNILSLETSCDETAAAIIKWQDNIASVVVNTVSSQASLHAKWGGVVPDLASREHIKNIVPVIEETLERAKMTPKNIDLIAVTQGPGLMPALLIGVTAAKTLSLVWKKPLIGINHLEGHIYANFVGSQNIENDLPTIDKNQKNTKGEFDSLFNTQHSLFPLIALIVSGGHTQLMLMRNHFHYELLGETQDDAAGEAFDKVAKMLGLSYPGGPLVAKRADIYRNENNTTNKKLFPRPMIDTNNYNFSFSGLKTAVLYFLKKHEAEIKDKTFIDMVCHEFQEAVVDVLVEKSKKAILEYRPKTFTIAGGVSANVRLREQLHNTIHSINLEAKPPSDEVIFSTPEFAYSLDNAAMIGVAAAYRYANMDNTSREKLKTNFLSLDPDANLPLC